MSIAMMIMVMTLVCGSCSGGTKEIQKVRDLEFTVVEESNIPEELLTIINQKKTEPFKLTFDSAGKEYRYIAVGYGAQTTGGYSIQVEALYLANNAIYFDTNLIGPKKEELVTQVITYPYIVVKTEYIDKNVVFQ